jgi:mono/diheme cytochrome c family protein
MKITVALLCLAGLTAISGAAQTGSKPKPNSTSNPAFQRGKYLTTQIGLCQDCHTPRDQKGAYVQEKWLQGAPIMFNPAVEIPWAGTAPPIAGLEGWSDPQILKFLTTGIDRDGKRARPPMPEYRFSKEDAKAVAAYLRSLNASSADKQPSLSKSGGN